MNYFAHMITEWSPGISTRKQLLEAVVEWAKFDSYSYEASHLVQWLCSGHTNEGTQYQLDFKQKLQPLLSVLMEGNGDVTFTDHTNRTLLHHCILEMTSVNPRNSRENYREEGLISIVCDLRASIIADDHNGDSPLSIAMTKKRVDLACKLLRFGRASVNETNGLGQTALHIVIDNYSDSKDCRKDYINTIKFLLERGADLNKPDNNGVTPSHLISKSLDTESGVTSLHLIAEARNYLLLRKFQISGADLHIRTNTGDDLLTSTCKNLGKPSYNWVEIWWFMEDANFDANCKNKNGFTPLHYASTCDDLFSIRTLVDAGADIQAVAIDGTNCLHSATMSSSFEVMQYLIKRGVDVNFRDSVFGFTLIHAAAFNYDERKCEWLLCNKFDPNDRAKCDLTPLCLASIIGNAKVVGRLLEHDGNANCRDSVYKYTPLHLASMSGRFPKCMKKINGLRFDGACSGDTSSLVAHCTNILEFQQTNYESTIDILLSAGADVNARDKRGCTPLHYATRQSNCKIVEMLLKAGARVDVEDNTGFTPIQHSLFTTVADDRRLHCLLLFGANINDIELTSEETKVSPSEAVSSKILGHLVKLDVAGLPVSDLHRSGLAGLELDKYHASCSEEMKKLRGHMLTSNLSLYDLLRVNFKRRATFIDRLPCDLEIEFPHYCTVIRGKCNEAVNRMSLLKAAEVALQSLTGSHWPERYVEYIFSFLSNRNLNVLIDSMAESGH